MGTRSRIAVMHGTVCKSVYCHWDGYLEHNGEILAEHYDGSKANELVAMGDLSSLGTTIGSRHPFSQFTSDTEEFKALPKAEQERVKAETEAAYEAAKAAGHCTFYGRDRDEKDIEWKVAHSFEEFLEQVDACGGEYYYVMENGVWYCGSMYGDFAKRLVRLDEALETVKETENA